MSNFFVQLWESIFSPGTTPQLIIATHASFFALLLTLASLIYTTGGNIHFIIMFALASVLWLTVIWFIYELQSVQLKSNKELEEPQSQESSAPKVATTTATKKASTSVKSRKA
ncbi:hypothetical protein Kpol_339p2 [Vanderwaltozyma polyspora DSM 70294]|uniref:V-type ATPase assembly factor PKR1 n=1 Tax=Vanderwaltozyma polyspora (strain ATCC 22028 / DSM 70294 / BCRC 21397 / CBS 2163 / NBRC 10782 / NRRL Y-8283 / UCD 57-17) TaxID=436907 RepID=A7TSD0_VANPO|nr:uncharacterized protein Kpol_339p2 [Vanderwaltozyma polyspora DSM 70294]EDO14815.1 hypothetical protein Kpol_339p2 [Vanderwaltozyma polyspora DSM 70294]